MRSSHIWPARRGTNCKNIYRMWHCLDWETVVDLGCALISIFVLFLLPFLTLEISVAEWLFSMAYSSLPSVRNWKYAAYRGTSNVPAVDDDVGKEDTAIRCGMTLDGIGERQQSQTCKQTRLLQIFAYDIIISAGMAAGRPREIENNTSNSRPDPHESTLWPSRICTRCSTVNYRETPDASQKGEFVIIRPGSQQSFHFWC